MHTILVLTDFSQAANNAASYACILARQLNASNIVLYHGFREVIAPGENVVEDGTDEELADSAVKQLRNLQASLADIMPDDCVFQTRAGSYLLNEINEIIAEEKADLVVMGTTGKGRLQAMVAGSNALTVCETSEKPVVLVPASAEMDPVSGIVFACDLKDIDTTIPREKIRYLMREFHVPVSVVYVGAQEKNMESKLDHWLDLHQPTYHQLTNSDVAVGIQKFALERKGSMIMLVARKHALNGLFHKSITKQLAFESTSPLLVIREVEDPIPVMPLLEI